MAEKSLLREPSRQPGRFRRVFEDRIAELTVFYEGNGRYPYPAEGAIGVWLCSIRRHWALCKDQGRSEWKVAILESLPGWSWDGFRENQRVPFLKDLADWYLSVDGIADPTTSIPEQYELARWLDRNRTRYKNGQMDDSRRRELESIPFWEWEPRNRNLDPKRSIIERELAWMIEQSVDYKVRAGGVTGFSGVRHQCDIVIEDEKIVIEHDGLLWHKDKVGEDSDKTVDLENAGWRVIRIREEPLAHVAGISVFVPQNSSMRTLFNKTALALQELGVESPDIDLEELGKIPGGRLPFYDDWYSSLEAFQQYIADGGASTPIATQETGEFKVGQWVYVQRRKLKRGQLVEQKKNLLESIPGWQWELKPQVKLGWDAAYERLIEYQKENGRIPAAKFRYEDGLKLGSWASYQRYDRRKGRLSDERVRMLEKVPGWYW